MLADAEIYVIDIENKSINTNSVRCYMDFDDGANWPLAVVVFKHV